MVKRFDVIQGGICHGMMEENDDGDYVLYQDYRDLLEKNKIMSDLIATLPTEVLL
jgi:hypothetical protein